MSKAAADRDALKELHGLVARSMGERLKQDLEDNIPTDAATLGAITKFLKDNDITADPADSEDLKSLRDTLAEQRQARQRNTLKVVGEDYNTGA